MRCDYCNGTGKIDDCSNIKDCYRCNGTSKEAEPKGLEQAMRLFDISYMCGKELGYVYKDGEVIAKYYKALTGVLIEWIRSKGEGLREDYVYLSKAKDYLVGIDDLTKALEE